MAWAITKRESIGLGRLGITSEPLVCYSFKIFPYPAPDTCAGSVVNMGDGHYPGGQSRNTSRVFLCLMMFRRLMTSRVGARLPNNPSRDYLAQYSKSSASFHGIHRMERLTLDPQKLACTVGAEPVLVLIYWRRVVGPIRGDLREVIPPARTVMQLGTLLVSTFRFVTSAPF